MILNRVSLILLITFAAAGCGRSPPPESARGDAETVEHMAVGTLNSVDEQAGTVNITHAPVPSANWPEMTMNFKLAKPGLAKEIGPGQRIDFHFTIESGMDASVTFIEPIK